MSELKPDFYEIEVGSNQLRAAVWKGRGARKPLLVFNGIGANIEVIAPLAARLTDRDVIAFDPPGVGGSGPASLPYRPRQLVHMAATILDSLGYDEVDVLGVSWGGAMAQQFAFQYGKRARRLILCATVAGTFMVPGNPKALMKLAHPRRYTDPEYMKKNFETLYGDAQSDAPDHSGRLIAPSAWGYAYQLMASVGWTSVPFLPFLKQPTLVLAGDNDQIVPVANGRFLAALIPGARLEIVKGGHLFLVSALDEVLPLIKGFLDDPLPEEKSKPLRSRGFAPRSA